MGNSARSTERKNDFKLLNIQISDAFQYANEDMIILILTLRLALPYASVRKLWQCVIKLTRGLFDTCLPVRLPKWRVQQIAKVIKKENTLYKTAAVERCRGDAYRTSFCIHILYAGRLNYASTWFICTRNENLSTSKVLFYLNRFV